MLQSLSFKSSFSQLYRKTVLSVIKSLFKGLGNNLGVRDGLIKNLKL